MTQDQVVIVGLIGATMAMFLWGRWRHDMVALGALIACVVLGLVEPQAVFCGFGHPAVITVACVLILSYGLQTTGAVDALAQRILPKRAGPTLSIVALTGLAAVLSGFMNNVGALALLMPVAIQMSGKQGLPPGKLLMPLAFGSILGGTTTLIGTPPNLIVSGFRAESGAEGFAMFDFSPVGLVITVVGVLFVGLIGWRLVPMRKQSDAEGFDTGTYLSEVRILEDSKAVGRTLREVEHDLDEADAQIVGMVRHDLHLSAPNPGRILRAGDILIIEAEPESLASALSSLGLKLEEEVPVDRKDEPSEGEADQAEKGTGGEEGSAEESKGRKAESGEVVIRELVAMPRGVLVGRSATDIDLRSRYGINLLAVSRHGRRSVKRLRSTAVQAGDVLLVQGTPAALSGFAAEFGCLPLAVREIRVPRKGQALTATLVMAAAIGVAALGLLPAAVSFAAGALAFVAIGVIPVRSIYDAVDWPVVVLLGAMLPVADAMKSTGAADMIARFLLEYVAQGEAVVGLAVILMATMVLTDFMNNAATAAVMCPIAIGTAAQLGVNADSFLMAVAIGASCAFLTPVGHQNNTLILGPGGFGFGDYWRMGLPTDILVVCIGVPMLLWVWPL
ncbi:SLC13 family permease [Desulfatiglans anilini]|uniref:SLC13 family permease n=1 Tax=Desulfatiglans anilini TaxID=90728 RepID=UPI000412566F